MQTTTKMILAICCIGAVAVETLTPVYAQRHRCQPGWTVQGGRCQPYRWGGSGYRWQGGWNTLEWMPTRLDGAGWKMRALSIRTVRQAANLLAER